MSVLKLRLRSIGFELTPVLLICVLGSYLLLLITCLCGSFSVCQMLSDFLLLFFFFFFLLLFVCFLFLFFSQGKPKRKNFTGPVDRNLRKTKENKRKITQN